MQIDASMVQWDSPEQPAERPGNSSGIDASKVIWDAPEDAPGHQAGSPATTKKAPRPGIAQSFADGGRELVRQAGLTARHGLEGLGQAAEIVTEPVRHLVTDPAARALGLPEGRPMGKVAEGAADAMGLPRPVGETERVVGDAARFMAGGAGMAGAAGRVARMAAPGPLQAAAELMAAS